MSRPSEITKQRLIDSTIRLVAAHGVKGVSVRTLTSDAGCRNLTAIHYHFGGKPQLIDAAILWCAERIVAVGEPGFAAIEARIAAGETVAARAVVQAWIMPAATLSAAPGTGPLMMRFFARILTEAADETNSDFLHTLMPFVARMLAMLHDTIPQVPPALLAPRVVVMFNSLVYILSDLPGIAHARDTFSLEVEPLAALHDFIEYHAAALAAPATEMHPELGANTRDYIAAWNQILDPEKLPHARPQPIR